MGAADAGRPGRLPSAGAGIASGDPSRSSSRAARTLFAIRWKVGELLGWDGPDTGLGSRVPTLRDRLPADLRDAPSGPDFDSLPFTSLYLLDDEWAAEIANRTMHGVLHLGWVADETGGYRGRMAVYAKPNGRFGTAYMAAIRPFRHLIVYPQMMRQIGRQWRTRARGVGGGATTYDASPGGRSGGWGAGGGGRPDGRVRDAVHDPDRHERVRPAEQDVDDVVLGGVDERERHRERVERQERPRPRGASARGRRDQQRVRRVQRRHRRHGIRVLGAVLEQRLEREGDEGTWREISPIRRVVQSRSPVRLASQGGAAGKSAKVANPIAARSATEPT